MVVAIQWTNYIAKGQGLGVRAMRIIFFRLSWILMLTMQPSAPAQEIAKPTVVGHVFPITADNASSITRLRCLPLAAEFVGRGERDGEIILRTEADGAYKVFSDSTLKFLRTLKTGNVSRRTVSPDGKAVFALDQESNAYFLRINGEDILLDLPKSSDDELSVSGSSFHPNKGYLFSIVRKPNSDISAGWSHVRVFDMSGKRIKTISDQEGWFGDFSFTPDGEMLFVHYGNGLTRMFDTSTWKLVREFPGIGTFRFSPKGGTFACLSENKQGFRIIDFETGRTLFSQKAFYMFGNPTWSASGDVLAISGYGKIILWDAKTFKKLKVLKTKIWIDELQFSSDGSRLISSSFDTGYKNPQFELWGISRASGVGKR